MSEASTRRGDLGQVLSVGDTTLADPRPGAEAVTAADYGARSIRRPESRSACLGAHYNGSTIWTATRPALLDVATMIVVSARPNAEVFS
jgi:hypothetical protein